MSNPKKTLPPPFLSEDAEACYNHFSPLVAGTPAAALEVWNADAEIVRVNVARGVAAVAPHIDQVEEALPLVPANEILELPSLTRALAFAADRVYSPASPQEIRARQQRLRPGRQLTLGYLEIAAELGLVPKDRVAAIRTDRGPVDEARDAVAIVALFHEHAVVLAGKHPFPDSVLVQLAEDGNWLLAQLLPRGAVPNKAVPSKEATVRDQLWTEVVRRYDLLYQAGVALWGRRKVDEHLPSLLTRAAPPRSNVPSTAAPAPSPV